ncbi:MAG TPA: DUF805 domain-containing protein [Verrucomicrobiae bacterium]|jgi:uncharacterized membrane protein YhaH (DUF805 family)|nr:DUF805 domain-containing protein [Verrucomicrobiae bacterium]
MKPKISDLWRWDGTLGRGTYLFWGLVLVVLKFNLDRFIGGYFFGKPWSLFDSGFLRLYLWQSDITIEDRSYYLTLLAASLPFIWAGTILTLRRLRSLGWSPWWVLLFFVPAIKLIFFALLCLLPARNWPENAGEKPGRRMTMLGSLIPRSKIGSALVAMVISVALALLAALLGTSILGDYGWSLFVGLPFGMGLLAALIYSYHQPRSLGACLIAANSAVLLAGLGFLMFAMEGAICLLMAAPLAFAIASLGGMVGYALQDSLRSRAESPRLFCAGILLMPMFMVLEHTLPPTAPLFKVTSSVIVNAPPEKVWRNVVSFSELPPPHELIFKLGVAYPIYAEIYGQGVGAVRHCNFSTGPFVEPIEVWDEPRLLKFSVTENPEPLQEWTPYHNIHPRHLDGYLASEAGQFRLVPLDGGRKTLLEGTTWYRHHMWPSDYWALWSDEIIHTIHLRVLHHVKQLSEKNEP